MGRGTIILNPGTFSNPVQFADGTAAAPSATFATDTDTGWYLAGANQIAVAAGGAAVGEFWTGGQTLVSTAVLGWVSAGVPTATPDLNIKRGTTGTVYFGNASATYDNEALIGDATHRLSTVHTKSITIGQSFSNPLMGIVTLSGGTGTASVQTTAVAANCRIFLTHQNASGTTGTARVTSSTIGTGFTIVSSSSTDTSTIAWFIFLAS